MGALVRLRAFAKINYALEVRGLRPDGYHEVATVMQSISLADEVGVEKSGRGFELDVEPEGVKIGPLEQNTVYRAWRLLGELTNEELPIRVRLHKNIPSAAGLGGASADAAAVLVGINELFELGLDTEKLRGIGARIGADVPFCISGGTALGEGVGDLLTPLPAPPDHRLLLIKPRRGADTAEIYRAYDKRPTGDRGSAERVLEALRGGDLRTLARSVYNGLAPVTKSLVPEVQDYEQELLSAGAWGVAMSGTGTAVYGIFEGESAARGAQEKLQAPFAGLYGPTARGVQKAPSGRP